MKSEAAVYLEQIEGMSNLLERVVADAPQAQFNQRPGPHLNPVGWNYFHLLRIWDFDLNWICKGQKRDEDAWHRGGFTEKAGYDPTGKGGLNLGVGYGYSDDEVDEIQIEPAILKQYQQMLMAETAAYLAAAGEDEMRRQAQLVVNPSQVQSVAERIQHVISHSYGHIGEMRYAMGVFGVHDRSYPGPGK